MIYLFHNVYGEENDLISSAAENVECIPFGWTEEAETYRNNKLQDLGISIGSVPCVIAWRDSFTIGTEENLLTVPAHWEEIRLADIEKNNWNWDYINNIIDSWSNNG
jgi:hypothetical protein